jgi:hypothetical protein
MSGVQNPAANLRPLSPAGWIEGASVSRLTREDLDGENWSSSAVVSPLQSQ